MNKPEFIEVTGMLLHETAKAYQFVPHLSTDAIWLPKSQVKKLGKTLFKLPVWLAKEKGINFTELPPVPTEYATFQAAIVAETDKHYRVYTQRQYFNLLRSEVRLTDKHTFAAPLQYVQELGIEPDFTPTEVDNANYDNQTINPDLVFHTDPFKHQRQAFEKMAGLKHGLLAMEMGTGKTKVVLDLAQSRYNAGLISKVLYLCPVTAKGHIEGQIWLHGFKVPYLIIGLESLSNKFMRAYNECMSYVDSETMLVIDEIHQVKNSNIHRANRLRAIAQECKYRIGLTGTTITNSPADLYGIFGALDPNGGLLGYSSWARFERAHLLFGGYNGKLVVGHKNLEVLTKHIQKHTFQITKEQCLDLPMKLHSAVFVPLEPTLNEVYERTKEKALEKFKETEKDSILLQIFNDLQLIASEIKDPDTNPKLKALRDILENRPGKITIWCKYLFEVEAVIKAVENTGRKAYKLTGEVATNKRSALLQSFRESQNACLVATTATGGTGIDLIECSTVVYFSNSFRYSDRAQSEDRFHRIGQTVNVEYIDIWTDKGIDRMIANSFLKKKDLAKEIRELIEKGQTEWLQTI